MAEPSRDPIRFRCNGREVEVRCPPMKRLLDVLREDLALTGTKCGCSEGECGSCTVLMDGAAVTSCLVPAAQLTGTSIETVEHLGGGGTPADGAGRPLLSPLQQSFLQHGGTQCGSCTPGILMTLRAHLDAGGGRDEPALREAMAGNICRCTGYTRILEAVTRTPQEGQP